MTSSVQEALSILQMKIRELYGDRLSDLVLFGSRARGDADPQSDIDVLVVLKDQVEPAKEIARTGALSSSLGLEYGIEVSLAFVSDARFRMENSPFLMNVRREGSRL